MANKNRSFVADLAGAIEAPQEPQKPVRSGVGMLAGRSNRLADLASGNVVSAVQELVDPARCRMWSGHNRDYAALSEERCHDLIESLKAQGRQEVPAIVRRVTGDPEHDFEVVCGARRHWSVSWLRSHNYPAFRFLIDVRELTDEEAFRLGDLENRARDDLSDLERARDYLRALDEYYGGRQVDMAARMSVTTSWLSRYLDLARLPPALIGAFATPSDLGIKHVTLLKPLLKPDARRQRVIEEAEAIAAARRAGQGSLMSIPDTIRRLSAAADPPKKSASPKRSGSAVETFGTAAGSPVITLEKKGRTDFLVRLTRATGVTRHDVEQAMAEMLNRHWS